jgi:hypothetical protein
VDILRNRYVSGTRQEQKEEGVMNLLEKLVERNERRLKKIDENPDPTKLWSNRLGYEIDRDHYRELLEAWQQGKPLLPWFPSAILARAMGALHMQLETFVDQFPEESPRYYQAVRSMGLPENVCDTMVLAVAAVKLGDLPAPSLISLCPRVPCRLWIYYMKILAEYFNVPQFEIDPPHEYSEESIKYLAGQLGELIEFAERNVPGIKYDQDRHLELLEAEGAWFGYANKEWELRKRIPLPVDSRDTFRQPFRRGPDLIDDTAKLLEFWRQRTEEIEERAARGVGREERLRVLWIWGRPVYADPMNVLEPRGVSVPAVVLPPTATFGGKFPISDDGKELGRQFSPLEHEASNWLSQDMLQRPRRGGHGWAEDIIWVCQDLKCDAIVYYQVVGCLHMGSPAKLVADMAERELGVPTLILAGREMEATFLPIPEFESRLAEFIDMVLAQKGRG